MPASKPTTVGGTVHSQPRLGSGTQRALAVGWRTTAHRARVSWQLASGAAVGWTWSRRVAAGPEQADLVHAAEASVRGSACVRVLVRRCGRPRTVTARSRSYFRLSRMRRWLRPRYTSGHDGPRDEEGEPP